MIIRKIKRTTSFEFKPFSKKQLKLLTWWDEGSPYHRHTTILCSGAIRAGKTIAMIDSFLTWSLSKKRGQKFIIASVSLGALERNILGPMFEILTAKGIPYMYKKSGNPYVTIGENVYFLFGASNEQSHTRLQGFTAGGAFLDEVALMPQSFVNQVISRCSNKKGDLPRKFYNCNPNGPYHWLKTDFIDKAEKKKIFYLHFSLDDNPSLDEEIKEEYRRSFEGVWYDRMILGLWVNADGLIYDMFDKDIHVVETVERKYTQYYVSCDYGIQNPFAMGLWGLCDGIWYKVREYHYSGREEKLQKTDADFVQEYKNFVGMLPIKGVIIDPSATSFIVALRRATNVHVITADNAVLDGIRDVASCLTEGLIKYNDCCKETLREYASYSWDEKAQKLGQDKPKKEHDHHMDADRYFVRRVIKAKVKIQFG